MSTPLPENQKVTVRTFSICARPDLTCNCDTALRGGSTDAMNAVLTPKVPRLLLLEPSLLGAALVGAMTGVPEGLPTPWGTAGRGEPPLGVCAGVVMVFWLQCQLASTAEGRQTVLTRRAGRAAERAEARMRSQAPA